jgi:acyl dehydratase
VSEENGNLSVSSESAAFEYTKVKNWPIPEAVQSYTARDTILYALGVAAATSNPAEDLSFVYEKKLRALPTMAMVLAPGPLWVADPATGIDLRKLLHGEQSLILHKPLPAEGTVVSRSRVEEIYDKGADKGAVMIILRELFDQASKDLLATARSSVFLRGNGGFGGSAEGQPRPHPIPERAADATLDLPTRPEQALIYRLSGDINPLHVDPKFAAGGGFDKPILHGLCSYGVAGRAVLKLLCGNDPARLKALNVRFASPVFPGETLRTEVWKEGPGRAAFRVHVVERDLLVLNNGYVEYVD